MGQNAHPGRFAPPRWASCPMGGARRPIFLFSFLPPPAFSFMNIFKISSVNFRYHAEISCTSKFESLARKKRPQARFKVRGGRLAPPYPTCCVRTRTRTHTKSPPPTHTCAPTQTNTRKHRISLPKIKTHACVCAWVWVCT